MAAMDPSEIVGENVTVLQFFGGLEGRGADAGSNYAETHRGETSNSGLEGNADKTKLAGYIRIREGLEAMGVDAIVTEPKLVN